MEAPEQVEPRGLNDYLEVLSKAVFQSGISWKVVEAKWPGIRESFDGFDPAMVADMTPNDIDRLMADSRVIRNRKKLEAIATNAARMLELDQQYGGFPAYLRSFDSYDALERALRSQFKFMGETGCYYFLYVVGEPVPPHEEWAAARGRTARGL